jgi:hypothetical protein|tara:strand:+ start:2103 stop:2378 length:276 start_codon:yes stop_codon:yes gene_type:complete
MSIPNFIEEDFKPTDLPKPEAPEQLQHIPEGRCTQCGSVGLGDLVETVTKYTGIKLVVSKISKKVDKDCGCKSRKTRWNRIRLRSPIKVLK